LKALDLQKPITNEEISQCAIEVMKQY